MINILSYVCKNCETECVIFTDEKTIISQEYKNSLCVDCFKKKNVIKKNTNK